MSKSSNVSDSLPVASWNRAPPISAPTMPTAVVAMQPIWSVLVTHRASKPATNPTMIQPKMPIAAS
jgi:hypothetical protein